MYKFFEQKKVKPVRVIYLVTVVGNRTRHLLYLSRKRWQLGYLDENLTKYSLPLIIKNNRYNNNRLVSKPTTFRNWHFRRLDPQTTPSLVMQSIIIRSENILLFWWKDVCGCISKCKPKMRTENDDMSNWQGYSATYLLKDIINVICLVKTTIKKR